MNDASVELRIIGQSDSNYYRSHGALPISQDFFRLLVLLAGLSLLAIWSTGYLRTLLSYLALPLLLSAIFARPLASGRIFLQLGSVAALLYMLGNLRGPTPGVVLLLQFASLIVFLQILVLDCLRSAHGVIILSIMIILAVAAMNINFVFPLILMPYIFVFYLILRHLAVHRHQALAKTPVKLRLNNPLGFSRLAVGPLASILIFGFLWLVMFYLIPRTKRFGIASDLSRRKLKGFNDTMSLGDEGLLEDNPAVIMRVRPVEEKTHTASVIRRIGNKLLRGATFARYSVGKWEKGTKRRWYIDLRRNSGELRLLRDQPNPRDLHQLEMLLEHIDPPVIFLPERTVTARFSVPYVAYEEDLSFHFIHRPGATRRYVTTVILDPEEPEDSPVAEIEESRETAPYLSTAGIPPRVSSLALSLAGGTTTISARVAKVMRHLRSQFEYSLEQPALTVVDPVEDFLFVSKEGSCEHFASSMVLLLRSMGIPARPVGGYTMGEWNEIGGFYTIRQRHAHAWVEVFFPKTGWITFDPTPPSMFAGPETEVGRLFQVLWETYEGYWFGYVYSFDNRSQDMGFRRIVEALAAGFAAARFYLMNPFLWLIFVAAIAVAHLGRRRFIRRLRRHNCWIPGWYSSWEEGVPEPRAEWETPKEYHQRLLSLKIIRQEHSELLVDLAELVDRSSFSANPDHDKIRETAAAIICQIVVGAAAAGEQLSAEQNVGR